MNTSLPALARILIICVLLALSATWVAASAAEPSEEHGGHMTAMLDGRQIMLPVLRTEIEADLQGDLAAVTVTQVFQNTAGTPLNATYLFPLNKDAAVHAMTMEVGDEIITAQIQRKAEARETFETAKAEGKAAALLNQHRPNMFTQEVANLMPGLPVTVTLDYVQTVPRTDGAYELVVPLIVGPRYEPAPEPAAPASVASYQLDSDGAFVPASAPADAPPATGQWTFGPAPAYPDVDGLTIPPRINADRVSITVTLNAGMPVEAVSSDTHRIFVDGDGAERVVRLAASNVVDNKDFVLRYAIAGTAVQAGGRMIETSDGGYFSVLIEPPANASADQIAARELVFVLDTSGSMSGAPLEASKTFMRSALRALRPTDYFRIVQFSSTPRELSDGPVPATAGNVRTGLRFVNGMNAGGGTEVAAAIRQAFRPAQQPGTVRLVVFLSDGYIGNEAEIIGLISQLKGDARVHTFGVGTAVNRYLMAEMARRGQGYARFISPDETGKEAARALANTLNAPVLTDITLDFGELGVSAVTPAIIPDLYAGDSIRVLGRLDGEARDVITLEGRVNGRAARLPIALEPQDKQDLTAGRAIPLVWARSQIADAMRELSSPQALRTPGTSDDALERFVTELGLRHALVTQWTSFVAVSDRVVNDAPQSAVDAAVPLPMVEGVTEAAYGMHAMAAHQNVSAVTNYAAAPGFYGAATPEPETLIGLIALLIGAFFGLRRRFAP